MASNGPYAIKNNENYLSQLSDIYNLREVFFEDDVFNGYNRYLYCGKDSDDIGHTEKEENHSKPTQSVMRLLQPIHKIH